MRQAISSACSISIIHRPALCLCWELLLVPLSSIGACRLPISDGGEEGYVPSKANIFGDIVEVELPLISTRNGKTKKLEQAFVSKTEEIFSVYGGFGSLADLKPEMQVWVWFENCKRPREGIPVAAYFQFFSTDPTDRATINRQGRIIAAPRR